MLGSEESVAEVASAFREALDRVEQHRPNANEVHLFAAVPVGLAFLLGCQVTATRHARIVTYQYHRSSQPRLREALRLPFRSNAGAAITDEERKAAALTRLAWETDRQQIVVRFESFTGAWWTMLGDLGAAFASGSFGKLQAARETPLLANLLR